MLKIKRYRLPKNKKYKYVPRYTKNEDKTLGFTSLKKQSMFERDLENSMDRHEQWASARDASRSPYNREVNLRLLAIIAVLIFLTLWIFDFDLSVFSSRR